jgi:hypothetical protein
MDPRCCPGSGLARPLLVFGDHRRRPRDRRCLSRDHLDFGITADRETTRTACLPVERIGDLDEVRITVDPAPLAHAEESRKGQVNAVWAS